MIRLKNRRSAGYRAPPEFCWRPAVNRPRPPL